MRLTVFTPTYNRVDKVQELFECISQSARNIDENDTIEWIIVDDGSEDNTGGVVKRFEDEALEIKYIRKQNGGKHTAFNLAIEAARGELFVCIDDDDKPMQDAFYNIFSIGRRYMENGYGGIVGRVVDTSGNVLGKTIFSDVLVSNTIEIRDKYHFWGEPEIYYTKILKNYRFAEYKNEKFLTEAYVFDEMSVKYPFVYTNCPMMVKEYLQGGLTDNSVKCRVQSNKGSEDYYYRRKCLCNGFIPKLKATINRQRFAYWNDNSIKRAWDIYEILARPISIIMFLKDRKSI